MVIPGSFSGKERDNLPLSAVTPISRFAAIMSDSSDDYFAPSNEKSIISGFDIFVPTTSFIYKMMIP